MARTANVPGVVLGLVVCLLVTKTRGGHYLNQYAVDVHPGQDPDVVAKEAGCENTAHILEDSYLFTCHHISKRSVVPHKELHSVLSSHKSVAFVEQQRILSRPKREPQFFRLNTPAPPQLHFEDPFHLNDDRWPQMWYMNRGGGMDMNVQGAWAQGITGKGISVTILDDGIERTNPDLAANYDPLASYDINANDNDPSPRYDMTNSNKHGTRCAGEVAASANNTRCAVGVAYNAGIGGVRMLDGEVTDAVEARAVALNSNHIDIYSASWGPDDDGRTVDGPGRLATRAFLQGVANGRAGKGNIFVWASGNGGRDFDNCNCDGYTNSIWTLSVSSATENGLIPWYSEACASTLASTYSSGSSGERKVVTTDLHHDCTSSHTGTSASAPMAAGILALVLEANVNLNWRDVQHLTVRCAHNANLRANDWAVNALGRNYSHSFGYGIMDAGCMVKLAKNWKTVPEQRKCSIKAPNPVNLMIPGRNAGTAAIEVNKECAVAFLEHVQAHVSLNAAKRGDVQITLTSPSNTTSTLIAKRPKDYSRNGFNDWPFLTVHMWEESPYGTWYLQVINDGLSYVRLEDFSLSIIGTEVHPQTGLKSSNSKEPSKPAEKPVQPAPAAVNNPPTPASPTPAPAAGPAVQPGMKSPVQPIAPGSEPQANNLNQVNHPEGPCAESDDGAWCSKCRDGFVLLEGSCVDKCPKQGYYQGVLGKSKKACIKCYYSCQTCDGPNDYQCLSCYGDASLEVSSGQKYCYNKTLLNRVESSSRWYYVLSIGFMVNFFIILILGVYIYRWRKSRKRLAAASVAEGGRLGRGGKVNGTMAGSAAVANGGIANNNAYGSKSGTAAPATSIPYRDYDSESEDESTLFRKPYTDAE